MTTPCGYQQILAATLDTGASLTVPTPSGAGAYQNPSYCVIVSDTQAIRWRDDGTAPTAAVGMNLAVGIPFRYDGNLKRIQFISATAGANLNVSYYY